VVAKLKTLMMTFAKTVAQLVLRRRACPECGATRSVLAGPRKEHGWCEACKAFVALPPAKKWRSLVISPKVAFAVLNAGVMISSIVGAVPVYTNLVNFVRQHEALALLDEADKGFTANQLQILDWFVEHGR
jgi:hypothetical protein